MAKRATTKKSPDSTSAKKDSPAEQTAASRAKSARSPKSTKSTKSLEEVKESPPADDEKTDPALTVEKEVAEMGSAEEAAPEVTGDAPAQSGSKKPASGKKATTKKAAKTKTVKDSKKKASPKKVVKKVAVAKKIPSIGRPVLKSAPTPPTDSKESSKRKKLSPSFLRKQQQRLLDLRDSLVSQMNGVARETLRGAGNGSESAFGMHQADAGSDSYDRDFALNLLSQEQDALYEIDEALRRIAQGTYGVCEMSGEPIPELRLEAMPFARLTVSCQEKIDQEQSMGHHRTPVTSLFGLDERDKPMTDSDS